jgi:hypothetical protein
LKKRRKRFNKKGRGRKKKQKKVYLYNDKYIVQNLSSKYYYKTKKQKN